MINHEPCHKVKLLSTVYDEMKCTSACRVITSQCSFYSLHSQLLHFRYLVLSATLNKTFPSFLQEERDVAPW